jgi:hypothetical protein
MAGVADRIRDAVTLGKGRVAFQLTGETGYEDMLEVDDFKFTSAVEKVEKNTSRDATVTQIASIVKSTKATGSFSCVSPVLDVLRFFGMASQVSDVSQTTSSLSTTIAAAKLSKRFDLGKVGLTVVKVRRTAGKDATVITDTWTSADHGFLDGDTVVLGNVGGALPTEFTAGTVYYVRDKAAGTLKLAATATGAAISASGAGTGTHTIYRSYVADSDYELDAAPGWIYLRSDGDIVADEGLTITGTYATQTMKSMQAMTKTNLEGDLVFLGDPADGVVQDFFAKVKLSPNGDFAMIGEDVQKFQIDFECIKSSLRTGLYELRDRSGQSRTIAATA